MKNGKLLCALLVLLLLLSVLCGCQAEVTQDPVVYYDSAENQPSYTLENEYLSLTLDGTTSYFTLTDKVSGEVWHSVPENGGQDPMADSTMKKWLQSTLIVTYTVPSGLTTIFDNYTNSIANGSFQVTQLADGIQVDYLLGESVRVYTIPEMISEERFNALIANLTKSQQSAVKGMYRKLDPQKPPSGEKLEDLVEKYPLLETGVIYVQRDGVAAYRYEQAEELFAQQGYTQEDYLADKIPAEDTQTLVQFNASVIYRLEGNALTVNVPGESLRCNTEYQLTELQVLPYFGAGSTEDEGYLLIPDGGGAMIDFNSRQGTASGISSKVYGWDFAKAKDKMIAENAVSFPVFAIAKNDGYLLAIAESGDGELTLQSNASGERNSYNSVSPSFEVVHGDLVTISSKSGVEIMIYEKSRQYEDLSLRYITGSGDSYVDMAHTYRAYLMDKFPQLESQEGPGLPLAVEMIGAMDHITQVMGVPMQTVLPVTDYQEAAHIISRLEQAGLPNTYYKYTAAFNGGMKQTALTKVKRIRDLGSQKELMALAALAGDSPLCLGAYASNVLDTGSGDGFQPTDDAIRNTLSDIVQATPYSTVTYAKLKSKPYHILNAQAMELAMENLSAAALEYGFAGIAPEDVGARVASDFNQETPATRGQMAGLQAQLMEKAKEKGQTVMVNGGSAYAVGNADFVLNMDLSGSHYDLVSRQIPFYQIALHGLVYYAGDPVNLADSYEQNLLKSAETGAGLYFLFAQIPAMELQTTDYTFYSGALFENWEQELMAIYGRYNQDFGHTANLAITDHAYVTDQVTVTVYEDGTCVYVNYGATDYTAGGKTVKSMDYLVTGGRIDG